MKLSGITLQGYKRIAQAIEPPAIPMEEPEKTYPNTLYHTTSQEGAEGIINNGALKARDDGFVSFSEVPVSGGDLEGGDVVLEVKTPDKVMKVEYNKDWFNRYPEQSAYIAGEDWEDQLDEEGKTSSLYNAFIKKEPEQEWISKNMGEGISVEIVNVEYLEQEDLVSEFLNQGTGDTPNQVKPYQNKNQEGAYTCSECGARFETEKGLKIHNSRSHKKSY